MALNASGWHLQECRRRGALEPLGRVELGGERLAQTCRSLAGNDRRWPAGPSPLIFPAGLVWESIPDPKSQGGRAQRDVWPTEVSTSQPMKPLLSQGGCAGCAMRLLPHSFEDSEV